MKEPIYGLPCVQDPHDFTPDEESCTEDEISCWKRACETYGTPEYQPNVGCKSVYDEAGNLVMHMTRTSWGIGVNMVEMGDEPEADELEVEEAVA